MIELCIIVLAVVAVVQTLARYRLHQELFQSTALLQDITNVAEMDKYSLLIVQSQIQRNQSLLGG